MLILSTLAACLFCAWLAYRLIRHRDPVEDSTYQGAEGQSVAILCDCDFNFPVCDSRCCPTKPLISNPEVWTPQADRRGAAAVFGGPATSVSTPFHPADITPEA